VSVLLDTHTLLWWAADPGRLSPAASRAIDSADELAVAAVSWWELAWLATHDRITPRAPIQSWLSDLSRDVRTMPLTPSVALTAARLPASFPRDPVDRLIYATALEHGWRLVSKDQRFHDHDPNGVVVVW
jgi:PIN domain nuclease of toxin-antitoxin system